MASTRSSAGTSATPHSASAIVADAVEGSHVLKVQGFSRTKGLGHGEYIQSRTFNVAGHAWYIRYYPEGYDSENPRWISFFLHLENSSAAEVKARLRFTLLDEMGEPVLSYCKGWGSIYDFTDNDGWGHDKFIEGKALEESCYLKDDCFSVRCDIMVLQEFRTEDTKHFVTVPPPNMHEHIGRLLSASSHVEADVTFHIGPETVAAHRLVLAARSPVFMAELFGPMKENNIGSHIKIEEMEAAVFKAMLHFIYTDSLPDDIDQEESLQMAPHLLVAADRYDIQRLKLICEDKLYNCIDESTATTYLALAEQHGCSRLKEACLKFLMLPTSSSIGTSLTPHSASVIVADAVEGSHVLKVQGYSRTKGLGNGEYIKSGTFNVAGHTWYIRYYPDGDDSENPGWLSFFLYLVDSNATEVKARLRFTLLDEMGEPVLSYRKGWGNIHDFVDAGWGYDRFIEDKALEESCYLKDDCFSVRCDVMVLQEFRTEDMEKQFVTVPLPDMHEHIGRLLSASSRVEADVTFQVGQETVTAHRLVLAARSPVFMAELFGPMKENNIGSHIKIEEMEAAVLKTMLHFIYTDSLPDDIDQQEALQMAPHLLVAADRYDIQRLKLMCEDMLCNCVRASTVTTYLALAEQHGCSGLKEACLEFLMLPGILKVILSSDGMQQLTSTYPSLLMDLLLKLAP